jgi:PKD repeat protein
VYVRKICTSNDTSSWNGPVTFKTPCIVNAPFLETFSGTSWVVPGTFPNTLGEIDGCYNRTVDNTYWWTPGPEQFPSFQTGPSGDHTTGTGKYLFTATQGFGGTAPLIADFVTPQINLVPLNTPELTFWYHMYGSQIGTFLVQINNGNGWVTLTTLTGQQQTSKTAPWLETVLNLSAYANDTIRLRFRATKGINLFNTEIAIDDIDIHELPACPKPTFFSASNVTFNTAQLNWTTGGASNWIIKYGVPGFTAGTFVSASTNPFVLTGLTPNTNYEVWVRDSCSNTSVSQWVGPVFFRTSCLPIAAPFTENFSGSSFVPWTFANQPGDINPCYSRTDTNLYYWVPGPPQNSSFQTGPSGDKTTGTGKYMYTRTNAFPQTGVSTSLQTPFIDLGAIVQPQLRFWYHMFGLNIDKLQVRVRRYDGTVVLVKTITGQQQFSNAAPWLQEVVDLSAFAGDTIRVQFSGFNAGGGVRSEIALDDIEIGVPLLCQAPTNLSLTNITASTVTVNWTSSASAAGSIIEYGPTGFAPGTGTLIHNVTSPHIVTGLTGSTAYQFYIQDSCSWGGLSTQIGPQAATTLFCPPVTAAFSSTTTGLSVVFDASASAPNITTYTWNFGDGTNGTGVNPTHVYGTGGNYTVTLVVANLCGSTNTIVQTISTCSSISGQFTTGINGLTVNFSTNSVLGNGLQFGWLYGDGNTGTGAAPSHTYAADGAYTVQLIATDICGNVDTITQTVTVCGPLAPAIVYTQNGLDVNFSVTGADFATNYNWNFGDGNTGSGATPLHTYAATGTYNVTVTVTNLCGQQTSANIIVTLCVLPTANWTFTILSSSGSGMTVQFNGTASIGASSYLWEFGDGATNNVSAIPVHTYIPAGLFWVVKLTVFNDCGDTAVKQSSLATVGIYDFEAAGLKTFPNPADDQVVLLVPDFIQVKSATMVNSAGAIMATASATQHAELAFETATLPEGIYFINLVTNAGKASFKVVVKH